MGRSGQLHPGPDPTPGQWRGDSPGAPDPWGTLEAGQALDPQPRSGLPQETNRRDRLIRLATTHPPWALGFADEVWWSRLAPPAQQRWGEAGTVTRLQELTCAKGDPAPKALACYGLLVRCPLQHAEQRQLRFVAGRPVSAVTTDFLVWCCDRLAAPGLTALLLIWDHASWHTSQAVRTWIRIHNQRGKASRRGVRMVACVLPVKRPWLNPIEPKWVHGTRAISDPEPMLSAGELEARVYASDGCEREEHLVMPKKVA